MNRDTSVTRVDGQITVQPLLDRNLARDIGEELLTDVTVANLQFVAEDAARRQMSAGQALDMMITAIRIMRMRGPEGKGDLC